VHAVEEVSPGSANAHHNSAALQRMNPWHRQYDAKTKLIWRGSAQDTLSSKAAKNEIWKKV